MRRSSSFLKFAQRFRLNRVRAISSKRGLACAFAFLFLGLPLPAFTEPGIGVPNPRNPICSLIETAAAANGLPLAFFARVIWQESRFQVDVVGPMTRSGQRAEGIAQFMPDTAAEHRLLEPFNPAQALPKSGEFLAELRDQFGNLGLAAAAYNAGPQRVREFITGTRELPLETRDYVVAITGRSVEDWATLARQSSNKENLEGLQQFGTTSCDEIAVLGSHPLTRSGLKTQVHVPNWCNFLHRPNISVCGSVHEAGSRVKISGRGSQRGHPRLVSQSH